MEFGHSEGTFTLKKFLVYLVKMPSELQNSQNLTRESRFVVSTHLAPVASGTYNKPQKKFFGHSFGINMEWKTHLAGHVVSSTSP